MEKMSNKNIGGKKKKERQFQEYKGVFEITFVKGSKNL